MTRAADAMRSRLREDLVASMRARRPDETKVLRSLIAALDNGEAVPVTERARGVVNLPFGDGSAEAPRRELSGEDVQAIIRGEIESRIEAASELERVTQDDRAAALRAEAAIAQRYLD